MYKEQRGARGVALHKYSLEHKAYEEAHNSYCKNIALESKSLGWTENRGATVTDYKGTS